MFKKRETFHDLRGESIPFRLRELEKKRAGEEIRSSYPMRFTSAAVLAVAILSFTLGWGIGVALVLLF